MEFKYMEKYSLEEREKLYARMTKQYPGYVFVILEKLPSANLPVLERNKFAIWDQYSVGHFHHSVRQEMQLRPDVPMFFFCPDRIPIGSDSTRMCELHKRLAAEDGHIYMIYGDYNVCVFEEKR